MLSGSEQTASLHQKPV